MDRLIRPRGLEAARCIDRCDQLASPARAARRPAKRAHLVLSFGRTAVAILLLSVKLGEGNSWSSVGVGVAGTGRRLPSQLFEARSASPGPLPRSRSPLAAPDRLEAFTTTTRADLDLTTCLHLHTNYTSEMSQGSASPNAGAPAQAAFVAAKRGAPPPAPKPVNVFSKCGRPSSTAALQLLTPTLSVQRRLVPRCAPPPRPPLAPD